MTILQVLKKIKHLDRKINTIKDRISRWCSHSEDEPSPYEIPKLQQSLSSLVDEISKLRHVLHATNAITMVQMEGEASPKTLDEYIILKTFVLPQKIEALKLMHRSERGYSAPASVKNVIEYDPSERDKQIDKYEYQLEKIDTFLDTMNITLAVME